MSRESITRYTGEGEPPCIVMTLRAVSDETTPPNLTLPVTITGVNEVNKNAILIERTAEGNVNCNLDSHTVGREILDSLIFRIVNLCLGLIFV